MLSSHTRRRTLNLITPYGTFYYDTSAVDWNSTADLLNATEMDLTAFDSRLDQTVTKATPLNGFPYPSQYSWVQIVTVSVLVTLIMLVIVLGNGLVVLAIAIDRNLKGLQNWFIASLAVSDLFVGLFIMPLSLTNELLGYWVFGDILCELWLSTDVLLCTASILNLCLISLDRYWSITRAISYVRQRTRRRALVMISVVWVLSMAICFPPLAGWKRPQPTRLSYPLCVLSEEPGYVLYSIVGSFYLPLAVMVSVYFKIYLAARSRARRSLINNNPTTSPSGLRSQLSNLQRTRLQLSRRDLESSKSPTVIQQQPLRELNSDVTEAVPSDEEQQTEPNKTTYLSSGGRLTLPHDSAKANGNYIEMSFEASQNYRTMNSSQQPTTLVIEETTFQTNKGNLRSPQILTGNRARQLSDSAESEVSDQSFEPGVVDRFPRDDGSRHCPPKQDGNLLPASRQASHLSDSTGGVSSADERTALFPVPACVTYTNRGPEVTVLNDFRDSSRNLASRRYVNRYLKYSPPSSGIQEASKAKRKLARARERRATLVLGIVMASFIGCWLPFFSIYPITSLTGLQIPSEVFGVIFWLGYCNSALNPIIYTIFNREFRQAFQKILFRRTARKTWI